MAGVASSAALEAQTDFYGYFEHFPAAVQGVTNLPQSDPQDGTRCLHFLQNGTVELGLRVDNSGSDAVEVATLFNACQSTIEPEDAFFFKWVVAEVIASSMEVNTPSAWSVNDTCAAAQIDGYTSAAALDDGISYLSAPAVDTMAAVQRAFQFNLDLQFQLCLHSCEGESDTALMREVLFRPLQGENGCVSFDEAEWITSMRNTSNPLRAWWWQRCTQLGWFHGSDDTTASQGVLFPGDLPVANVVDYCQRIFDVRAVLCGSGVSCPPVRPHSGALDLGSCRKWEWAASVGCRAVWHRRPSVHPHLLPFAADALFLQATIASTPNVTGTNLHLGGVSAYSVKTAASSGNSSDNLQPVLFTNADMDPFAALAPNSASSARGIEVIDYVGGHNSLGFVTLESESDPPSLTSARHSVVVYMVDAFAAVGVGPGASTGSAGDDSIAVAGVIFMASLLALLILIAAVGATVSRARHKIVRTGVSTSTEGAPESGGGGGSEEVKVSVD